MFDSARDRSQREIRAAPSVGCFRGGWEKERKGKRERRGTGRKSLIPLGIWRFCRRKKRADFCDEKVHFKDRFFEKAVGAGFAEKAILITPHDVGGGENYGKVTRGVRFEQAAESDAADGLALPFGFGQGDVEKDEIGAAGFDLFEK